MNKMLLILDPANPLHRTIRRILFVGVAAFVSAILSGLTLNIEILYPYVSEPIVQAFLVPVLTAAIAGIDKLIREMKASKQ